MPRSINKEKDDTLKKLLKFIPSEIVGAFIVVNGIIPPGNTIWEWGMVLFLLILVPIYLWKLQGVNDRIHLSVSSISFLVWVFAIGGPFTTFLWYQSWMGSIILALWTLIPPLVLMKSTS